MKFNTVDTQKNVMVAGCGDEVHLRELAKLDKVKLKRDAHTSEVTSTRLKVDKLNNLLLISGSKDKFLNLFLINEDFPRCDPLKRINSGETIFQASLFGKEDYYFDVITKDHTYQVYDSEKLVPIVNFKANNVSLSLRRKYLKVNTLLSLTISQGIILSNFIVVIAWEI